MDQKPFEGDTFIPVEIQNLIKEFGLETCLETGTQYGTTTLEFSKMFREVITVEADPEYYREAILNFSGHGNITPILGRSEIALSETLILPENLFIYLDAHGCEVGGCPLKQELEILSKANLKNIVIAIHDFKVPGKDFGFDTYDFELKIEEIESLLQKIYPDGFGYHYNEEASGANRGIIYIYPSV